MRGGDKDRDNSRKCESKEREKHAENLLERRKRGGETEMQSSRGGRVPGWMGKQTNGQVNRQTGRESNTARAVPWRESLREEAGGRGCV